MSAQESLAIVSIGIDFYPPKANVTPLCCAVNDAEAFFALFLSNRRYVYPRLLVDEEATRDRIRDTILEAAAKVPHGTLIVTFSGHGCVVQRQGRLEAGFLTADCPHDLQQSYYNLFTDEQVSDGVFTLGDVKIWLRQADPAPANLIFLLDTCYSGLGIVSDPAKPRQEGKTFDGRYVLGRSLGLRSLDLNEMGIDDSDFLADNGKPWPIDTKVATISAATSQELAHEIPELGHGAFSLAVLEWLKARFLANPDGTSNFCGELFEYVHRRLREFEIDGQTSAQTPNQASQGVIELSNASSLIHCGPTHNLVSVSRGMPVPWRPMNQQVFDEKVRHLVSELRRRGKHLSESNVVLESPRLSGTRAVLKAVVKQLEEGEPKGSPVLYLATGRVRRILPLLGSLGSVFERAPDQLAMFGVASPLLGESDRRLIDAFVDRLHQQRAIVVVPYRRPIVDDATDYLLEQCASDPQIKLVLALYAGETIPEWMQVKHYRRPDLSEQWQTIEQELREAFHSETRRQRLEEGSLEWSVGNATCLPGAFVNNTLLHWLCELRRSGTPPPSRWLQTLSGCVLPWDESRNPIRGVLNVLEYLLPIVDADSQDSITLLKAMSAMGLPRSERLVANLWDSLHRAEQVDSEGNYEHALTRLTNLMLVNPSADDSDPTTKATRDLYYFVHGLVAQAVREYDQRSNKGVNWHGFAAEAYQRLIDERQVDARFPRPILIHETVHHFLKAARFEDACRVLLEHWGELADSGYQGRMLKWVRCLRPQLQESSLIKLLLRLQDLYEHRQERGRIRELHDEIEKRTRDERSGDGPQAEKAQRAFWKSRENIAKVLFNRKELQDARTEYEACYKWAGQHDAPGMECRCAIRLAHCDVLQGNLESAERKIEQEVEPLIDQLEAAKATATRRRLRSVQLEMLRLQEDEERLYKMAVETWRDSLASFVHTGSRNRFDLAISEIHVAWASLFRGQFLRAWRHAAWARKLLNDRVIAAHFWFAETERIAGLAIAHFYRGAHSRYVTWCRDTLHPDPGNDLFRADRVEQQRENLERLISVSRFENPWRAAELMSALGQLIGWAQQQAEAGIRQLEEAIELAVEHHHLVLKSYAFEAIALLEEKQGKQQKAADHISKSYRVADLAGLNKFNHRRMSNHEKALSLWRDAT